MLTIERSLLVGLAAALAGVPWPSAWASMVNLISEHSPDHYRPLTEQETAPPPVTDPTVDEVLENSAYIHQARLLHAIPDQPGSRVAVDSLPPLALDTPSVNPVLLPLRFAPRFSVWLPYWDAAEALQVLGTSDVIPDEVDVFAYHFGANNTLIPATSGLNQTLSALTQTPSRRPKRLLITAVNDVVIAGQPSVLKSPQAVHDAITDPEARARHIRELVAISQQADGIEIDYENLRLEDREAFTQFIRELGAELHASGKFLSVAVEPRVDDRLRNGPGVNNWRAIAPHVDRIKVMAYYFHFPGGEPGSIAPASWLKEVTRYAQHHIPQGRLTIALAGSGIDWAAGQRGTLINYSRAMALAAQYQAEIQRDADQTPFFRYAEGGVQHEVWFEDAVSLSVKRNFLRSLRVQEVGLWHVGDADPAFLKRSEPSIEPRTRFRPSLP